MLAHSCAAAATAGVDERNNQRARARALAGGSSVCRRPHPLPMREHTLGKARTHPRSSAPGPSAGLSCAPRWSKFEMAQFKRPCSELSARLDAERSSREPQHSHATKPRAPLQPIAQPTQGAGGTSYLARGEAPASARLPHAHPPVFAASDHEAAVGVRTEHRAVDRPSVSLLRSPPPPSPRRASGAGPLALGSCLQPAPGRRRARRVHRDAAVQPALFREDLFKTVKV